MAVNHDDVNDALNAQFGGNKGQAQGQQQGQTQGQDHGQQQGGRGSFNQVLSSRLYRPQKLRRLGEALATMYKVADEIHLAVQNARGYKMVLVPVDGQEFGMHYSCAALVAAGKENNVSVTSVFVYILEGSNSKPGAENVVRGNIQYQRERTAMEAMDKETWNCVCLKVADTLGDTLKDQKEFNYLFAGSSIVPSDMDLKEEENVHTLMWLGAEAIWTNIEKKYEANYEHWNLKNFFNQQTDKMAAMFVFNGDRQHDIIGKPVRSDICAQINIVDRGNQNPWLPNQQNTSFQHSKERRLGTVCGFVNAMFNPQVVHQGVMTNRLPSQVFVPHLNITEVLPGNEGLTPELYFLNLFTFMIVSENYGWVDQFSNFASEGLHEFGQIGRRVNGIEDVIKTKGTSTTMNDINEMARMYFTAEPIVSVDCADAGPNSWNTDALRIAGSGNVGANQFIIATMDRLTNNEFSPIWKTVSNGAPLVFNKTKIHLGTFRNPDDGSLLDIREIDSLAALSLLGHNDMQSVNNFELTYGDTTGIDPEQVLSRRLSIIRELTQNNVDVYGSAIQAVLSPQFRMAGVAALKKAGLAVDSSGLGSYIGNNFQTAMNYMNAFMGTSNAANLLYNNNQNVGGWNSQGMSRF